MLDRNNNTTIFSNELLDLTQGFTSEYVEKKIVKISSAQTKTGTLVADSKLGQLVREITKENFIEKSQELVENWAHFYNQSEDGPSSDLLLALYEKDTQLYLAFMKLTYKEGITHFVEQEENKVRNKLMINRAILPASSAKPEEALAVNLSNLEFELLERRYEFSGEKRFYMSEYFIDQEEKPAMSMEESAREVRKLAKSIGKKYEDDEHEVLANVKEALYDSFEEYGTIDNDFIAEKVFGENLSAKLEYKDEMMQALPKNVNELSEIREISEKKFGKQKLKMDNGIELIVPLDVYRDANAVEFINNPDGTVSIMIKNIEKITNKF